MTLRKKILIHTACWIVFETLSFFVYTMPFYNCDRDLTIFITTSIASIASSIVYFYSHYFIVPLAIKKRYFQYISLLFFATGIHIVVKGYCWHDFQFVKGSFSKNHQVAGFIYMSAYLLFISAAIKVYETWFKTEKEKKQLEKEIIETELQYLKSQMNPHFLFNTLNNIYGLALKNNPNTSIVISQLKDMLDYNTDFSTSKRIKIEEELNYLKSYINLFNLRSSSLQINFDHLIETDKIEIEPMLLLPFIENAFKHGSVDNSSFINIQLNATQNNIYFKISNPISAHKRKDITSGIGIKNVQRRLELIYKNRHQFSTSVIDNHFTVELNLRSI